MAFGRIMLRIAAALTLGTITAAAVALGLAACFQPPDGRPTVARQFVLGGRAWAVYESHAPGMVRAHWTQVTRDYFTYSGSKATTIREKIAEALTRAMPEPAEDPHILLRDMEEFNAAATDSQPREPALTSPSWWGQFARGECPPSPNVAGRAYPCGSDFGFGWPLVALWYQVPATGRDLTTWSSPVQGGYVLDGMPSAVGPAEFRVLPLRPAWIGFALDAALFAGVWAALGAGAQALRRARRKRRGLCLRCAYDRRGLSRGAPCPECGAGA